MWLITVELIDNHFRHKYRVIRNDCRVLTTFDNLRYGFSFSLFRKMRHTVGCGMMSSLLLLTVDFVGLRTNACLTCSTCSSVTDGLPVFLLLHAHPVSWNCAYHLRMKLSDGGCLPNLVRNCRWTIITDWHSWNISIQKAFSLPFAAILVHCAPSEEMYN